MMFEVVMRSPGGVEEPMFHCREYLEAVEFCEERNWEYTDEHRFVWELFIRRIA